jgi:phage-related tail fiber protein
MGRKFLTPVDFNQNEVQNAVIQVLAADPGSPIEGQIYYNSTTKTLKYYTGAAWITLGRLDQISNPTASVSLNSQKITNLADGVAASDAATKGQLDVATLGFDYKGSVRAATTAAGTLATDFENGDTIDGVVLATGNRILIKDQAAGAENGIYTVNASGAPTRATDADSSAEVTAGMAVVVTEGTSNADTFWVLTTNDAITLGTTALAFSKIGPSTAGGVAKFTTSTHASATAITITHNLNTKACVASVAQVSDDIEVYPEVDFDTVNTAIFRFSVAPTANTLRFTIVG